MSKRLTVIICLILVLIGVVVVAVWSSRQRGAVGVAGQAIVIPTAPGVEIKAAENEAYKEIAEQKTVRKGAFVRTGSEGEATIILADNSVITMDINSEIELEAIPGESDAVTQIVQLIGSTWHRVESISGGGSYEVSTSSVIAAVRGTTFGVNVEAGSTDDDTATDVFVVDSKVGVRPAEGIADELQLQPDESIRYTRKDLRERRKLVSAKVLDRVRNSKWYQRNKALDKDFGTLDRKQIFRNPELIKKLLNISPKLLTRLQTLRGQIVENSSGTTSESTVTDLDQLKPEFNHKYAYPLLGSSFCATASQGNFEQDLIDLDKAAGYLPEHESLATYGAQMQNDCQDGAVNSAEYDRLRVLHAQVGNHEGNLLKWDKLGSYESEVSRFLYSVLGGDKLAIDCKLNLSLTATTFLAKLNEIQTRHSAPVGGDDLTTAFKDAQVLCAPIQ